MEKLLFVIITGSIFGSLTLATYKQLNIANFETGNKWLLNGLLVYIGSTLASFTLTQYMSDPYRTLEYWLLTASFHLMSVAVLGLVFFGRKAAPISMSIISTGLYSFCMGILGYMLAK